MTGVLKRTVRSRPKRIFPDQHSVWYAVVPAKRNAAGIAQRIEIPSQVEGKIRQRALSLARVNAAERANAGEHIVKKVRLYLADHNGDTLLQELLFLLLFVFDLHSDIYLDETKRHNDMSQCDLPDDRVNHYRGSHQQLIEKERDRLAVGQHPPEVQNDADVDHHRHGQKKK